MKECINLKGHEHCLMKGGSCFSCVLGPVHTAGCQWAGRNEGQSGKLKQRLSLLSHRPAGLELCGLKIGQKEDLPIIRKADAKRMFLERIGPRSTDWDPLSSQHNVYHLQPINAGDCCFTSQNTQQVLFMYLGCQACASHGSSCF